MNTKMAFRSFKGIWWCSQVRDHDSERDPPEAAHRL